MVIVGVSALALAASTVALPSVADAAGSEVRRPWRRPWPWAIAMLAGTAGAISAATEAGGGYGYGGGYVGGYYGVCGPIQLTLGLCGPWGF